MDNNISCCSCGGKTMTKRQPAKCNGVSGNSITYGCDDCGIVTGIYWEPEVSVSLPLKLGQIESVIIKGELC